MTGMPPSVQIPGFSRKDCHPHDMLWLRPGTLARGQSLPPWVKAYHTDDMPVIVRRDHAEDGRIPAGIRGKRRSERAATWIHPQDIIHKRSPEDIIAKLKTQETLPFSGMKPIQAIEQLLNENIPEPWGVTGSCAFALATGRNVMHAESDLDLLIRCPEAVNRELFRNLADRLSSLPCRTDIQIETPEGAFSLKEWMRPDNRQVLLKTDFGPLLTENPWHLTQKEKAQQWTE